METLTNATAQKSAKDDKRAAILEIAYAAFLADGYAATSMSSIAAKVGGSKATLYNYFASKEELFAAVIAEKCEELTHLLFDGDHDGGDIQATLNEIGTKFAEVLLSESKIATYRLVTAETTRFPELGPAFYQSGPLAGRRRQAAFMAQKISEGHLKPGDTMQMAQHFYDLCISGVHQRVLWNVNPNPAREEIASNVERGVFVFLSAYGTKPPRPPEGG